MSEKPEQTKAPLIDRVLGRAYAHKAKGNQFDANLLFEVADALTIQRAFEERERELREALARIQDEGDARSNAIATQALATCQPTPTEGSSDDQ